MWTALRRRTGRSQLSYVALGALIVPLAQRCPLWQTATGGVWVCVVSGTS
ncbi:MAG: hypothetical protein ACRDSR_15440 [Pseudonocardiaceae bacterium]